MIKSEIINLKRDFAMLKEETVNNLIKDFPLKQQEAIKLCFRSCAAQSKHGMRYTINWIYECILMRIKSPSLYKKICFEKILPLPSPMTLQRYIKQLKPAYGFVANTFKMLQEKAPFIPANERHGNI